MNPSIATPSRLAGIEALRGFAALAVVFYHFPVQFLDRLGLPDLAIRAIRSGYLGVDAFFVLSGFVIALSLRSGPFRWPYFFRFILRRSIRLDPPYWFAILLEIGLGWLGLHYFGDSSYTFPTFIDIGAHVLYLQGILGRLQISDVFWTLCFEIQFYVTLVGLVVLANSGMVRQRVSPKLSLGLCFTLLTLLSLAIRAGWITSPNEGIAIGRLYQFSLGVGAYLYATKRVSGAPFILLTLGTIGVRLSAGAFSELLVTGFAVMTCLASVKAPSFNAITAWPPLQFLGRISYSLYLYHASIVGRISALTLQVSGTAGILLPWIGFAAGVAVSVLFAFVVHRVLEAPMMRLSRRIDLSPAR